MAEYELRLPNMGESVAEATLTSWLKQKGDSVSVDDAVLEVATDKVDSEVISEYSGVLVAQYFKEGDVVKVGEVIAVIATEGNEVISDENSIVDEGVNDQHLQVIADEKENVEEVKEGVQIVDNEKALTEEIKLPEFEAVDAVKEEEKEIIEASIEIEKTIETIQEKVEPIVVTDSHRFYSPLVKNIATKEGVAIEELETITGTGSDGRVTKSDIIEYVSLRSQGKLASAKKEVIEELPKEKKVTPVQKTKEKPIKEVVSAPVVTKSVNGADEIIEMDRMRKMIAGHMRNSIETSVHVQSFMEADVTDIWNWRSNAKESFQKREGEKLTFTPVFLMAIAKALRDFPLMNISVDGDTIIKKHNINIGMATALPTGNLIVPVIKNADQLSLSGMAKAVNDYAVRAKTNKLKPDDVMDGTFTVSNIGSFGSLFGTPIINQPQVGIIALGAIRKVPAVIETEEGDYIGIRHKMFITHAYDHRVVDGALGGLFLKRVVDYLEDWDDDKNCF